MRIARYCIDAPVFTWIVVLICLLGGTWGFFSLGRLEDPAFTIKTAAVVTQYPGATAEVVAREVSEPLESAIQKMSEVDTILSVNTPGQSLIEVEIKSTYDGTELPDIWTKLRARIDDAARSLPDGVSRPYVNDSFGDVFGLYYAVTAPDFTDQELHDLATFVRRVLLTVPGVADVDVSGLPEETIYVDTNLALTFNQGVPPQAIVNSIATANSVAEAGERDGVRIDGPEGRDSVSDIEGLSVGAGGEVIRLADIVTVTRGRVTDPSLLIRHDGVEAFTIGIAGIATANIVTVGQRVDAQLAGLAVEIPSGVSLHPIYQQHIVVDEASNAFLINLATSVGIVVVVLALFMGWRAAIVVGSTLLLTVAGTLLLMALFAIEMERISLGALIIAMGMLVDNAIVIAEGMQTSMLRGRTSREAADETSSKTQIPLLGATVIGIMAFAGIGLSPDATGEFLFSLFAVIGISLILSWILAITVTPLLAHYFFKVGKGGEDDAYGGLLFKAYGAVLRGALRFRWLVIVALIGVTAACFMNFGNLRNQFFPDSNTPLFFVHYKLPQGTPIEQTSDDLARIEAWLAEREEVRSVTTFVGDGATRFMLTYPTQRANPSYGHMIVRVGSIEQIAPLQLALKDFADTDLVGSEFRTKRLLFGPGGGDPIQLRLSGPDPKVLRRLGLEAKALMLASSDDFTGLRTDWREQELVLAPVYADDRAQTAGIARDDVASTLKYATEGITAGVYREDERLIPIVVRAPPGDAVQLSDHLVYSEAAGALVPLTQVTDGFEFEVQNTLVHRRDRVPTLTVSGDITPGVGAAEVHSAIREAVEAMELPQGYQMVWGGEFEDSTEAQQSLAQQLPVSLIIMVVISILLFNAVRQPLIIWLLVPMSVNGVVVGLLATDLPFSFTALLGLLSLSGMLIKNGIVLVEEIDLVRATGKTLEPAIVEASVSRLRPVVLAAATTILGMLPLLGDAFFVSMAVTIMGGLAFASILTLIAAPVFYRVFFARDGRREAAEAEAVPA
ncbi:MAG: efflux RND transporter permease subunit [Pseudomonadota bacterium]